MAILAVFGHQVENGDDRLAHATARDLWRLLYVIVFASVAWWRVIPPLSRSFAHRARVAAVVRAGRETV